MSFAPGVWLGFLESLLPAKDAAGLELAKAVYRLLSTPEFADVEDKGEAFIHAFGGKVTRDPVTGHIATIDPPPYVAPAHQSPGDFIRNSSGAST